MILIRRILITVLSLIGSLTAIIILALVNAIANTGLTGGQVVLYGLISGIVIGVFTSYLVIHYFVKKAKKFIYSRFGGALAKFGLLKRI